MIRQVYQFGAFQQKDFLKRDFFQMHLEKASLNQIIPIFYDLSSSSSIARIFII